MTDLFAALVSFDGGLTLLAPIVAIGLALATKRVVPSLAIAAAVGALVAAEGDPLQGLTLLVGFVVAAVWDLDHVLISAFSLCVAATVGVMGRSGGMRALIGRIEGVARGRRGAMGASWLAGGVVFFDDYANCLVVGSSMGPLYDRFRVSRAKLAYIVDATAAPVASLAIVSTWVGYEVGLFEEVLGGDDSRAAFQLFISALPYRFYCLFTIAFVGAIALSGRDFGPMLAAEQQARSAPVRPAEPLPAGASASLAVVPVVVLVGLTFALLYRSGWVALGAEAAGAPLFKIIGAANPYPPMLWGSSSALVVAAGLALATGALNLRSAGQAAGHGVKAIAQALVVLYLAWTLGDIIKETGAGAFLASILAGRLDPWMLPAITFLLASATAFATGSSFFTMGALIPLVVPLAFALDPAGGPVLLATCAAVLDGAVLGDHASPISDTTILSSIGANVDLLVHVRTQLPYVLTVGVVAVLAGSLPSGLGVSLWVTLPIGVVVAVAAVFALGTRVPD